MHVGVDGAMLSVGVDGGFGEDSAVFFDGEVLGVAGQGVAPGSRGSLLYLRVVGRSNNRRSQWLHAEGGDRGTMGRPRAVGVAAARPVLSTVREGSKGDPGATMAWVRLSLLAVQRLCSGTLERATLCVSGIGGTGG